MTQSIFTVVGARPQFIKAAVVSHAIKQDHSLSECLVHTGQHYDYNMSQTFFDELSIPEPKLNLGISGGSHAAMTARMMIALEKAMLEEGPAAVLLYGDTNSTLAAALVAAKLNIPIAHVEAGTRTRSMSNPEEINRVCTDRISSLLMTCTEMNLDNLIQEDLGSHAVFVGDPMFDAFKNYQKIAKRPVLTSIVDGQEVALPSSFYYLTCHREENTRDLRALTGVLEAMDSLDAPVVYPVHPRNRLQVLEVLKDGLGGNVLCVQPIGYLESVYMVNNAKQVVTDSGGLQREAFFAGVKCTTVLDFEVWPETMVDNRNSLAKPNRLSILEEMQKKQHVDSSYQPFGNGNASENIVEELEKLLRGRK